MHSIPHPCPFDQTMAREYLFTTMEKKVVINKPYLV
jgi:hypothetical protein